MAIITLSRGAFSGAGALAQTIASRVGYSLVSREDLIDGVAGYGVSEARLARARGRRLGLLPRLDLEWLHYLVYARVTLCREIRDGNLLYLGDDGRSLLADFPNVLRVHIVSDMSRHVEAIVKRNDYAVSRREAMRLLKRIDAKRDRWGRVLHKDGSHDPSGFDLVIDPAVTGNAEASELVLATAELPGFQTTRESLAVIERVTLAAEIRARIALHEDVVDDRVMVHHVLDGVIRVGGSVHSKEDMDAIRDILGVQPPTDDAPAVAPTGA